MKPLKPRLQMLKPRIRTMGTILEEMGVRTLTVPRKTPKQRQQETGRTLALNGKAWRDLRAAVLRDEPTCRYCRDAGRLTAALELDHADNDPSNNDRSNLVPACRPCHSRKTAADMGKSVTYGCDADGMPLDPAHPWNAEKSRATDSSEPPADPSVFANREKPR